MKEKTAVKHNRMRWKAAYTEPSLKTRQMESGSRPAGSRPAFSYHGTNDVTAADRFDTTLSTSVVADQSVMYMYHVGLSTHTRKTPIPQDLGNIYNAFIFTKQRSLA